MSGALGFVQGSAAAAAARRGKAGEVVRSLARQVAVEPVELGIDRLMVLIAETLAAACWRVGNGFVVKVPDNKANRTSLGARRAPGIEEGLAMLAAGRERIGCPALLDIHGPEQRAPAAEAADIIQLSDFLCRETDVLLARDRAGAAINVKECQFIAPWKMAHVAGKVASTGNARVLLTAHGVSFGHNTPVIDMGSLPVRAATG
jgi:2-dehydro-3-deoxyphosphooctonate aldolase (KDO 8-P synthase)